MKLLAICVECFLWMYCPVCALLYSSGCRHPVLLGSAMRLQSSRYVFPGKARYFLYKYLARNSIKFKDPLSMNNLGVCYAKGLGTTLNPRKAYLWYKQSGLHGCAQALHSLGGCYYNGFGTNQNLEDAYKSFYCALKLGCVSSACYLGLMYSRGEYVNRSERKAYLWYRYGALHGDCNSQYDFSVCLRYGEGCNASEDEAEKWLAIAAHNGSEEALECLKGKAAGMLQGQSSKRVAQAHNSKSSRGIQGPECR